MRHNYYKMEIAAAITQPLFCVVEILYIGALLAGVTVPRDAVNLSLETQCHGDNGRAITRLDEDLLRE